MKRLLIEQLLSWQQQKRRKPVLVDGARQVGKTYLLEQLFGRACFKKVYKLDFMAEPGLSSLFEESLEPKLLIENIEIRFNCKIDLATDLIFFDEIGECQNALNSLKYFAEQMPAAFICASGSNIGLLDSFPVGKVHILELFPLCFEEFLSAVGNPALLKAFQQQSRQRNIHEQLWAILLDYYFVGGMPEAVDCWFNNKSTKLERCKEVTQIHKDLIVGYQQDFGKYSGKIDAQHIAAVFTNVPRQLSANVDASVKRFTFKDVIERKNRYAELKGPISWLEKAKLVSSCYPVTSKPLPPLATLIKENIFKIFLLDVGLLGHLLEMSYSDQQAQKIHYKGYFAENFVQNELRARVAYPTYSWEEARSEIEFLHRTKAGEIIPVEVKSGSRTRAKSLRFYVERYAPSTTVKLIGSVGSNQVDSSNIVWPLYYAQFLAQL